MAVPRYRYNSTDVAGRIIWIRCPARHPERKPSPDGISSQFDWAENSEPECYTMGKPACAMRRHTPAQWISDPFYVQRQSTAPPVSFDENYVPKIHFVIFAGGSSPVRVWIFRVIHSAVPEENDWAFVALCDDGSLWLYHGSWSHIENIPQTTNL